ncbi:MAG TPA: copper-containing nitrite reductase, partial [Chloroflexota bacterium]|nr:copper-containing nitrite reductase [Chloroflexota bacterium]
IVIVVALAPLAVSYVSSTQRSSTQTPAVAAQPALPTSITVNASEFKFVPNSIQVPMGQKVTFTLDNTGVVEHDMTIQAAGFTLLARAGQTATGEFTFDKAGVFDFICSVAGHKDAGMKGTLTVVDTGAGSAAVQQPMAHEMSAMTAQPSIPADLKALPAPQVAPPIERSQPAYVKYDLTTQKVTAKLADGVAYEYWTFNGTVPGPMLRVREGDTVEINLGNAADAGVTHSIDLHAVTGPGGGAAVTQVMPGETGSFSFQALNPGVYIYHCATPMVAQHIANGMYGMIVVEPQEGLPRVDHEIYLMEGDFYLQGQRGDTGLRAFDLTKMLDERPDYVLFNGSVGANTGANAFQARVGDTVRIFFGVGGPNLTSSFHVIGEIFDRVYPEGALADPEHNVQTTHVPAGGATVVEFTMQVPGTYAVVDHSLGRLEKGAAAQIVVQGEPNPTVFQPLKTGSAGAGGH